MNMEDKATANEYPQFLPHNMNGKVHDGKVHDGKDMMATAPIPAAVVETKGPAKTKKRKKANRYEDGKQPPKAQKAQSKRPNNSQVKVVDTKKGIGQQQQGGGEGSVRSDCYHQGEGTRSSSASSITSNIGILDDKDKKSKGSGKAKSSLLKKKTWVPDDDEGTNDKDVVAAAVTYSQQSRQQPRASSDDDLIMALQRKVENEMKKEALAQKLQILMNGGGDDNVSANYDQPITSTVSERRTKNEMKKAALAQKLHSFANYDQKIGAYGKEKINLSTVPLERPNHGFGQPGKKSPMEENASSILARSRTEAEDDNKSILNLYQSRMTQLVAQEQQQACDVRGVASARSESSNLVTTSGSSPSQSPLFDDNAIRHLMLQSGEQQRAFLHAPQVQESLRWVLQHEMQTNYQENGGDDPEVIMRRQLMKEAKRAAVAQMLSTFMKSEDQEKNVGEEMLDEKQQAVAEQHASSSADSTTLDAGGLLLALSRGNGQWSVPSGERSHEQQDNCPTETLPYVDSGRLSASTFQGLPTSSGGVDNQAMLMQRLLLHRRENNGHAPQQTSQDNSQGIVAESQSPVGQGTDEQTMMLKLLLQRDLDDMNIQLRHQIQNNSQGQGINFRDGGVNLQHSVEQNHSDLVRQAAIQSLLMNHQRGEASQRSMAIGHNNIFLMDTPEARQRSLVESSMMMNEENRLRRLREAVQSQLGSNQMPTGGAFGGGDNPQNAMVLEQEQLRLQRQALVVQAMSQQSAVASASSTDPDAQALTIDQLAQLIAAARERR